MEIRIQKYACVDVLYNVLLHKTEFCVNALQEEGANTLAMQCMTHLKKGEQIKQWEGQK